MIKKNKKSVISLSILLITLSIFISSISYADKTYTIGVQNFQDYSPYGTIKKNNYQGFNRELLDMFASSQHFKFEYKVRPIKRLNSEFLNGNFDFKYPDNATNDNKTNNGESVYYSDPVVHYKNGLIVRQENQGKPLSELKTISIMNGVELEENYLQASQQGNLEFIRTHNYQRLLVLVIEKRVDGAYFDTIINNQQMLDENIDSRPLVFDDSLPYSMGARSLSSIKHPEIIVLFNQFLVDYRFKIKHLKSKYHIIDNQNR